MVSSKEREDFAPEPFEDPAIKKQRADMLREYERIALLRLCAPLLEGWDPKLGSAHDCIATHLDLHARLLRVKEHATHLLEVYHVRIDGEGVHFGGGGNDPSEFWGDLLCAVLSIDNPALLTPSPTARETEGEVRK